MSGTPLHRASVTASLLIPDGTDTLAPEQPEPARGVRDRRQIRLRNHQLLSATCAILIPLVVAVVARFTQDGPARVLLTWLIALLMGVVVYAHAASTDDTRRRTR